VASLCITPQRLSGRAERRSLLRWVIGTAAVGAAVVVSLAFVGSASATLNGGMTQVAAGSTGANGGILASPAIDTSNTGLSTWVAYSSCNSAASLKPLMSTNEGGAGAAVFEPVREHTPSWDGTRMVWSAQYESGGVAHLKLYMQNNYTSACTLTLFVATQDTTGITGNVSVTNFPATQPVSVTNFPASQTVSCPSCGTQTLTSGTTVALDGDSSSRLDLSWWGIWIVAGLLTVLIIRPYWDRLFNWNQATQ